MNSVLRRSRLATCLGVTLLAIGCSAVGVSGPGDGTFIGSYPDRVDFNTPGNWAPAGVPTATATIPVSSGPLATAITFSQDVTVLKAVLAQGDLGLTVADRKTLDVRPPGQGLILCCKKASASIIGELIGNVTVGDDSRTAENQLSGGGTIRGNIRHVGGTVTPGSGPSQPTMTVFGTYEQQPTATLDISVYAAGTSLLDVRGTATLSGFLFIEIDDPAQIPTAPFKVLTAQRRQGEFSLVRVLSDKVKLGGIKYNPGDVTITLTK